MSLHTIKNISCFLILCFVFFAFPALNAHILSVTGDGEIILAPPQVLDTGVNNLHQQGFNERQGVVLPSSVATDQGLLSPGTVVSSHMIFLNKSNPSGELVDTGINWTFDGAILGVMSDTYGSEEVASTALLGNPGTTYPTAPFYERGMEFNDSYLINGNTLTVNMHVFQPGDWIRVVTQASLSVPEPASYTLLTSFLGFAMFLRQRRLIID